MLDVRLLVGLSFVLLPHSALAVKAHQVNLVGSASVALLVNCVTSDSGFKLERAVHTRNASYSISPVPISFAACPNSLLSAFRFK